MSFGYKVKDGTKEDFKGRTIREVRTATPEELASEGWSTARHPLIVLVLDDGTKLYPSQDPEGNGPGSLFGRDDNGPFRIPLERD